MKKEPHPCTFVQIHHHLEEESHSVLPEARLLIDLAELFKIFGDATRIKILYLLFEEELCVCDIARLLGMTQSAISHQLQILKKSKLVKYRRAGKSIFYSLADSHVRTILGQGMAHLTE